MHWRAHIGRYGSRTLPGEPWAQWAFLALLLLAAVLRFWQLPAIPYTHDEISGLLRTGYASFGELVRQGVAVDAHPPGVAVFLHYWTLLGGYGEAWVKAPFIVASLAALFLLYRFATAWTNSTVALVSIAVLATIQYTVMYAQIARPYAAGFFTCALLADQWTRWLAGGPNARRALIGMAAAFVLCAYMHHFALLFAGLVAVTGLVMTSAEQRLPYLIACGAAALLYLPNVPIFLQQLGYGGVGQWLAPPDRHWIPDHLAWVVQYRHGLGFALAGLVLISLITPLVKGTFRSPVLWIGLLWGLGPLAIGYGYSVWVDPVLQYSTLLFSFPFLLIGLLHGLPAMGSRPTLLVAALLAAMGADGLVRSRSHYSAFYTSKYEAMLRNGLDTRAAYGADRTVVLLDAPGDALAFLLREQGIGEADLPFIDLRAAAYTPTQLDSLLRANRDRVVAYGEANGAPPEQLARILERFPTIVSRRDLIDGQVFLLADTDHGPGITDHRSLAIARPAQGPTPGVEVPGDLLMDSLGHWDYSGREYGVLIELRLDTLVEHPLDRIEVHANLACGADARDAGLVLELKQGDRTIFYRTDELDKAARSDGRSTLIVATQPLDASWRGGSLVLRTYLHNRQGSALTLERITVRLREANYWQYGLFRPIPRAPRYP